MFTDECLSCEGILTPNILETTSAILELGLFSIKSMMFLSIAGIIISVYLKPVAVFLSLGLVYSVKPDLNLSKITTPSLGISVPSQLSCLLKSVLFVELVRNGLVVIASHCLTLIISDLNGKPFSSNS